MATREYKPFRPAWSAPCLCASGMRFRDCCQGHLPGTKIGDAWRVEADADRWAAAVKAMRADVTQYTIWHLSHTAPVKARLPLIRGKSLMKIDVEALSDCVETLMGGYKAVGREGSIPTMLDRLRGNIDDPAWHAKIAYLKAIERLWGNDHVGAVTELAQAGPISAKSDDVDLLQIQLDLHRGDMGLAEALSYMDRILELTTSRTDRLQYGGAKALQLIMAGDEKGGHKALLEVVHQGREMEAERPFGVRSEIWFCRALEGVAITTREQTLFNEIVERLERLLAGPDLTPSGRAYIGRLMGDAYRYGEKYEAGIATYRAAYKNERDDVLLAFEAECHLRLGASGEALRVLSTIDAFTLDAPEKADFAFIWFYVALARKDQEALETARNLLKAARTPQPYFERLRLSHIITVQEALSALAEQRPLPKPRGLAAFLRGLSRYVQMQPNIAGIGINLNNALDDIADRLADRSEPWPHGQENGTNAPN